MHLTLPKKLDAHQRGEKKMAVSRMLIGSPCCYLLLVVFQLLQHHCMAVAGQVLESPQNVAIAINSEEKAVFHCVTRGVSAAWAINGFTEFTHNRTEDNGLEFREVLEVGRIRRENIHYLSLSIPASEVWNQTEIMCLSIIDSASMDTSNIAYLTIMGGPASPEVQLTDISSSEIHLSWLPPFSWEQHPLQHFEISSNDTNYFMPEKEIAFQDLNLTEVSVTKVDGLPECQAIEFSVRANNGLGDSKSTTIVTGFPKALNVSTISIEETIQFIQENGVLKPLISLQIELPSVCWYQTIYYTVTMSRLPEEDGVSITTSTKTAIYGESSSVMVDFVDNLQDDFYYEATVNFWLMAENDEVLTRTVTSTKQFPVNSNPLPPTQPTEIPQIIIPLEAQIAIAIVCGAVLVVLIIIIVIVVAACRRGQWKSTQNRTMPMVPNAIYEGSPVYDTIDPLTLSSLPSPIPSTPTTPSSTRALIIDIDSEYDKLAMPPIPSPEHENYTIMISANQNKDALSIESGVRYVQEPVSHV